MCSFPLRSLGCSFSGSAFISGFGGSFLNSGCSDLVVLPVPEALLNIFFSSSPAVPLPAACVSEVMQTQVAKSNNLFLSRISPSPKKYLAEINGVPDDCSKNAGRYQKTKSRAGLPKFYSGGQSASHYHSNQCPKYKLICCINRAKGRLFTCGANDALEKLNTSTCFERIPSTFVSRRCYNHHAKGR